MRDSYTLTLARAAAWARETPAVAAVMVIGSQARSAPPADRWSDLDLMIFAADPQAWMADNTWFARFGQPVCYFDEIVPLRFDGWQWCVKRVLYAGGSDVDFSILPYARMDAVLRANREIIAKGWRVIYEAAPGELEGKIAALLQESPPEPAAPASAQELEGVTGELLYHVIWAYKKIRRGELWVAASCINCHMKNLLLRLVEAHNQSTGRQPDPLQYGGRFLERRAAPEVLARLEGCLTRYDASSAVTALECIFALTRDLDREICEIEGAPFDAARYEGVAEMFAALRREG